MQTLEEDFHDQSRKNIQKLSKLEEQIQRNAFFVVFFLVCLYLVAFIFVPERSQMQYYEEFCVLSNVLSPASFDISRISQILHISYDLLDERLIDQVVNWNGPVSVCVVLDSWDTYHCTLDKLNELQKHPTVLEYLRAHILIPSTSTLSSCRLPKRPPISINSTNDACSRERTTEEVASYPVNFARNVARKYSKTKFIIIVDYEHLFSENFERKVRKVAADQLTDGSKAVLVYRLFEIDYSVEDIPRNKIELEKLLLNGSAVIFHQLYYPGAHNIERLDEWLRKNSSKLGIFFRNLRYQRFDWEPQFVSRADIPLHDEGFPFQIRDNTVLRWELCRAGYKFHLLEDVFMVHRGIKKQDSLNKTREVQRLNSPKFLAALEVFVTRMRKKYPSSRRRCPRPAA